MRILLIRSALGVTGLLLLWLFATRPLSLLLDRVTVRHAGILPTQPIGYDGGGFRLGDVQLTFAGLNNWRTDVELRTDHANRLVLSTGGQSFVLGPRLSAPDPRGRPEIEFAPDPGDVVGLRLDRSWLAWPAFLEWGFMSTAPRLRRHAYYRLSWKKRSGAQLDMLWKYQQREDAGKGWSTPAMMFNFATGLVSADIRRSATEEAAAEYAAKRKGWKASQYRIESRGAAADNTSEVLAVIFLEDERGAAPGGGKSVLLWVDRATNRVTKEQGAQ